MKALVKAKPEKGLWMQDMPKPEIGPKDVLIKIKKTAICGTDLHIYKWDDWSQKTIKTPMIIGHEYVGTIVEMGNAVTGLEIGERVTGEGHIPCGECRNCRRGMQHICDAQIGVGVTRTGAFAEYLAIPYTNVIKLDDRIPDDIVAIMDPYGNAAHTALSFPVLGEDVLVTGAGGPIGAMVCAICKFSGARNIVATDTNDMRLEFPKKMGATRVVNPTKENLKDVMSELGMVGGFDIGLECSGSPYGFRDMLDNMYNGGKIALLGILPGDTQVDWNKIIFKGLQLKGIYGREMYETWYKMKRMLLAGLDLSPIITHHYKVDDFQKGFDAMEAGTSGKVILDWE